MLPHYKQIKNPRVLGMIRGTFWYVNRGSKFYYDYDKVPLNPWYAELISSSSSRACSSLSSSVAFI